MRISDWSSDVCSSDLKTARHQYAVHRLQLLDQMVFIFKHFSIKPADIDLHPIGEPPVNQCFVQRFISIGQTNIFADNAYGDFTFRIGVAVHDIRSEEHTSELQSLMRISYAVFCLKKKTPYT